LEEPSGIVYVFHDALTDIDIYRNGAIVGKKDPIAFATSHSSSSAKAMIEKWRQDPASAHYADSLDKFIKLIWADEWRIEQRNMEIERQLDSEFGGDI
jgi:hypothetical protein